MKEKVSWLSQQDIDAYNSFEKEFNDKKDKKTLTIENFDLNKYEDQRILMEVLLKNKTEQEIRGIVHGLMDAHPNAEGEDKEMLWNFWNIAMNIGKETRGMSWN